MNQSNKPIGPWRAIVRGVAHPVIVTTLIGMLAVAIGVAFVLLLVDGNLSLSRLFKTVFLGFFVVFGLGIFLVAMRSVAIGMRFHGTEYFRNLPTIWRLANQRILPGTQSTRPSLWIVTVFCLGLICLGLAALFIDTQRGLWVAIPLIVIGTSYLLIVLFTYGQTPIVFVLGVSSEDSLRLKAEIQNRFSREIGPVGSVVSLLNVESFDGPGRDVVVLGGWQRTNFYTWRDVARSFVDLARFIVIDARETSAFLEEEIHWISEDGLADRCFVLIDGEGENQNETLKRDKDFRIADSLPSLWTTLGGRLRKAGHE